MKNRISISFAGAFALVAVLIGAARVQEVPEVPPAMPVDRFIDDSPENLVQHFKDAKKTGNEIDAEKYSWSLWLLLSHRCVVSPDDKKTPSCQQVVEAMGNAGSDGNPEILNTLWGEWKTVHFYGEGACMSYPTIPVRQKYLEYRTAFAQSILKIVPPANANGTKQEQRQEQSASLRKYIAAYWWTNEPTQDPEEREKDAQELIESVFRVAEPPPNWKPECLEVNPKPPKPNSQIFILRI